MLRADKVYESEAAILVTPVPDTSEVLVSVGLISTSVDPLRAVETVAALIDTHEVASRAQQDLEGIPEAAGSPDDLLEHVSVTPVAESNIVSITADASTPEDAAAIANAIADATIAERTDELHGERPGTDRAAGEQRRRPERHQAARADRLGARPDSPRGDEGDAAGRSRSSRSR